MATIHKKHGERNNTNTLILFIFLLCVCYVTRDLILLPVPEFVFVAISLVAFCILPVGHGLGYYIFTSLLILPGNPIRLLYMLVTMYKLNRAKRVRISIAVIGMMLLQLMDMFFYSTQGLTDVLYLYVEKMLYILVPMLWLSSDYNGEDVRLAALCHVFSAVFAYSVFLIMTIQGRGFEQLLAPSFRLGFSTGVETTSTMASGYNSNAIATTSAMSICYLLALMDKKVFKMRYGFLLSGLLVLFAFLTRSRTGLLMIGIMMVLLILYYSFFKGKIRTGIALIVASGILFYILYRMFPTVWSAFLNRFRAEDITNGRATINEEYLEKWLSQPFLFLFGYGIGNYVRLANISITNSAHNAFVDILMCWGLVGMILLIAFLCALYKKSRSRTQRRLSLFAYLPMLMMLFAIQGGQYLTTGLPHVKLALSILFIRVYTDAESREGMHQGEYTA